MDLSFNKIKYLQKISKTPSFNGVKAEYNQSNRPVLKFNPPPYDKDKEIVTLEIIPVGYNKDKESVEKPFFKSVYSMPFDGDEPLRISQKSLLDMDVKGVAYRYKISNKKNSSEFRYFLDKFEKIETCDTNETFNLIKLWDNYKIDPKAGPMRHSFLDSDAILDLNGKLITKDKNFTRNHFNKLGGSTKGLIELVKTGELDSYRYIISTPDIGNDQTTSHRYWPNNLYQCENMQDFKDLNYELFIRGKGYVADGVFTDQSLQSPMFQHVLKWGKESPFYNMFKLGDADQITLGILPNELLDNEDSASNHIGIRIVNNPNNNENYDKTKPILFQLYDDRLSSEEQRNNTTKLIDKYDSSPEDIFEITHNDDSVYPLYFEVDPARFPQLQEKIDLFKEKNALLLKEIAQKTDKSKFLDFGTFKIGNDRHHASNATFWDGNRDVVKLNLSNSSDFFDGKFSDKKRIGLENARNYIYGVATFHTEAIQNYLLLKSAQLSQAERIKIAKENSVEKPEIITLNDSKINYPILNDFKKVAQYIDEFPLQSLETSPELSAIFSEPGFNKEFLNQECKNGDNDKIFVKNYLNEKINDVIDYVLQNKFKSNPDKEYGQYVAKIFTNDIIRYIYAAVLNKDTINEDGTINLDILKKVTLKSLAPDAESPLEERTQVIGKIIKGIESLEDSDIEPIKKKILKELENVSTKDFKESETLLIQSKAGLNWRFDAAKDIGDLDAVRGYGKNFKDVWDGKGGVVEFWHDFISRVKKYNPASYIIAELTDLWSFYDSKNFNNINVQEAFDKNGKNPDIKESNFLVEVGATTNSNYSQYFNKLSCFLGVNPESNTDPFSVPESRAGNVDMLRDTVKGFIESSQPTNALLTHEFFDNHDKPRLLHCLPLNMKLYLCGTDNISDNLNNYIESLNNQTDKKEFAEKVKQITGREDFANINPMALAVGMMMNNQIDKMGYDQDTSKKLKKALKELVNGQKTADSSPNYKRAKSFGTKPYEITIKEMFKRAGIINNLDEDVKDFHSSMLKPYMEYLERLWQVMNSIVGTPTLFNGTEFAQTGYETPSKNVYVDNRNQVLHDLKNDKRYKDLFDKISAASGLYKQPQMSAIREGAPILCKTIYTQSDFDYKGAEKGKIEYFANQIASHGGFEKVEEMFKNGSPTNSEIHGKLGISADYGNHDALRAYYKSGILKKYYDYSRNSKDISFFPIFKYDDRGSQVLTIISNNGVPKGAYSYLSADNAKLNSDFSISSIDIVDDYNRSPLPEETRLKKKIYQNGEYVNEKDESGNDVIYIVKDKKLKRVDGQNIKIEDTTVNFFVDKTIGAMYSPYNKIN